MLQIKKLIEENYEESHNLFDIESGDKLFFKKIGWGINQLKIQLSKENNFSLGAFTNGQLVGFLIGDLINCQKDIEYEILLIYVKNDKRKLGYANKLLNEITKYFKDYKLKKIYLEVSSNNHEALELYKKNNFMKIGIRKNYYIFKNTRYNAFLLEKKINE